MCFMTKYAQRRVGVKGAENSAKIDDLLVYLRGPEVIAVAGLPGTRSFRRVFSPESFPNHSLEP